MATHDCKQETTIALIKQSLEVNSKLTEEIHKSVVGNGHRGLSTEVELLKQSQTRSWWAIGVLIVGSTLLKIFV
jgi:hypothetical protein